MSVIINDKEYYGIIYKIENKITNTIYIGQTTHPNGFNGRYLYKGSGIERVYNNYIAKRNTGGYYNVYLLRSIEKYGFEAFEVDEVFDVASTMEELNEKEKFYIAKFDSCKHGYNMTFGGDSMSGYHRLISADCPNSKPLCQIDLDGKLIKIWDCATDVERELGINQTTISMVCSGKRRTAGGFVWVHESDYDENKKYGKFPPKKNGKNGSYEVLLLNDNGNIKEEFASLNKAAIKLGISVEGVRKICQHKIKNPKYNLVYKSEYMEEQRLSEKGLAA